VREAAEERAAGGGEEGEKLLDWQQRLPVRRE